MLGILHIPYMLHILHILIYCVCCCTALSACTACTVTSIRSLVGIDSIKKEKTKATPTAKKTAGDLSTPTKNKNDGDASKEFDKSWFKAGLPKKYGCVTVYCDRVNQKYRVKDGPGSRKHDMFVWGKTEKDQKSQWKIVQQRVKEYNGLMSA